jgi:hypothetical protein
MGEQLPGAVENPVISMEIGSSISIETALPVDADHQHQHDADQDGTAGR